MNILYIAASCAPNKGSEAKIGWNIPLASAKHNNVFVLTAEKQRSLIEPYLQEHPMEHIKFYYVDVPWLYQKLFRGRTVSMGLNIWHRYALSTAKDICQRERIDVIHQITPVEFRSIGDYGKIGEIPFVCGPVGGGEYMPPAFRKYARRNFLAEAVRRVMNGWALVRYRVTKGLRGCSYLFFANTETMAYLSPLTEQIPQALYSEIGVDCSECTDGKQRDEAHKPVFLVAGRLVYRKGHRFLLDVLAQLPQSLGYECRVAGSGAEEKRLKKLCKKYGLQEKVTFLGRISYEDMAKEYEGADVLIMPGLRETTGSVLLEAMAKGVPVVTINGFGGAVLLDETTGWLYEGNSLKEYKDHLCEILMDCAVNLQEVCRRGEQAREAAKKHLWENKLQCYQMVYDAVTTNRGEEYGRIGVNRYTDL